MTAYQPRYPLARAATVKEELLCFTVDRQSVMECDPRYLLNLLKDISSTRQQVLDHEGGLSLVFQGWDDDPRETAEIPESRAYFQARGRWLPAPVTNLRHMPQTAMGYAGLSLRRITALRGIKACPKLGALVKPDWLFIWINF